jgi:hypothetical protein
MLGRSAAAAKKALLFSEPRLPQYFAFGRLGPGSALDADCVRRIADLGGIGVWLGDEASLEFLVGAHRNIDVRVRVLALHVTAILWRVWRGGMRFAV